MSKQSPLFRGYALTLGCVIFWLLQAATLPGTSGLFEKSPFFEKSSAPGRWPVPKKVQFLIFPKLCTAHRSPIIPGSAVFRLPRLPESAAFEIPDVQFCAQESQNSCKCML